MTAKRDIWKGEGIPMSVKTWKSASKLESGDRIYVRDEGWQTVNVIAINTYQHVIHLDNGTMLFASGDDLFELSER